MPEINPSFAISTVSEMCRSMLGIAADGTSEGFSARVAATISLKGPNALQMTLLASEPFAVGAARAMFGEDAVDARAIVDSVAELVNIVAGNLKPALGMSEMSLPTVINGEALEVRHSGATRSIWRCAFSTPIGVFSVDISEQRFVA